ncbi:MAG: hypothetical protein JSS49_07065 [Planctomycetes bacterium]|nr:hypothetical protein [Planctomycetota bacterium]
MNLSIEPIWPWPVVILTTVGLIALVVVTYRTQLKTLPAGVSRTLLGLKLAAVIVLAVAMLRPVLQRSETDESPAQLLVVPDISRSMNTTDMPGGVTRFNAVRTDVEKILTKTKTWKGKVDVRVFDFASGTSPYAPELQEGTGDQTDFGKTLDELLRVAREQKTLAIILLSDGAQRALPPAIDPLSAARSLADAQTALYGIGYGGASIAGSSLDLGIEDLVVPEVVFEKNRVPVKAKLRATGAAGRKVRVRILVEDRSDRALGEAGDMLPAPAIQQSRPFQEFDIKGDSEVIPVDLSFAAMVSGEVKIALQVEPIENELLTGNNQRGTIITVRKGGVKVAYFDTLRPEQRWLRAISGADKIQLDFQEIRGGSKSPTRIDSTMFDRGRYDVYIIGDVRAETFGDALLKQLALRLEEGSALLMTGGVQNFAVGGYATSPIADWIPVELDPADARPPGIVNRDTQNMALQKMIPTGDRAGEYVMQLGPPEKNNEIWASLPPLKGSTRFKPITANLEPWARNAAGDPLLFAMPRQRSRIAAFAGDTTYLWWTVGDKQELHQRFWRQLILWLARKEADSDQPVWVKVAPRSFAPGAKVDLQFGARTADGLPLDEAEFQVEVTNPEGQKTAVTPRKFGTENLAEFAGGAVPGDYWVRVRASHHGKPLDFTAATRFIVDARDLELDYPSADYDFLKELSSITGGQSLKPEEIDDLLDRLKESKTIVTRVQSTTLWDNWGLLLVFVSLISLEWFVRKTRGLV